MELFIGIHSVFFSETSFRVRCVAPQVRSLRKIRVNLYRKTPRFFFFVLVWYIYMQKV